MAAGVLDIGYYKVVREGNVPKLMKDVSMSGFAAGKLNTPTVRSGGYGKDFNPRTTYGGAYHGSGFSWGSARDDYRGNGSGRCKSNEQSRRW
jgi:hypothetical protein